MKKRGSLSFIILLCFCININIGKAEEVAPIMRSLYFDIFASYKPVSSRNCNLPKYIFRKLTNRTDKLSKHFFKYSEGYNTNFSLFSNYLSQLLEMCQKRRVDADYSKRIYKNMLKSCFQCHSSDNGTSDEFPMYFGEDIETKILHLLVSRNYSMTKAEIGNFFKKPDMKFYDSVLSLEQDLYLFYEQSPTVLRYFYGRRKYPKKYQKKIKNWIKSIDKLKKFQTIDEALSYADKLVNKRIGMKVSDDEIIQAKYLLGDLNKMLHVAFRKDVPKILYYLGSLEYRVNHDIYSVDNFYLRDCVVNYSDHPFSKKCLKELKGQVEFSFTGSRGTDVPNEVINLIKGFEKNIKANSKKKKEKK